MESKSFLNVFERIFETEIGKEAGDCFPKINRFWTSKARRSLFLKTGRYGC